MIRLQLFILALCITSAGISQNITGSWHGLLSAPGAQLRLVFHIRQEGEQYLTTMDSPDQGVNGIPVTTTRVVDSKLTLEIPMATIKYEGEWIGEKIIGNFSQAGQTFAMDLSKEPVAKARKPQEPLAPFPYSEQNITFENKLAGITLAGTLTIPLNKKNYPLVILITGSGPQNRDEELLGHKPFLVLADYLTRQGIAVLRYDDRGTAGSTGNFETATTADFAQDVQAAVDYVKSRKDLKVKKIGLVGHSEGGLIAPIVASNKRDIAYMVLMAAPATGGKELLLDQQALISRASGYSEEDIARASSVNRRIFEVAFGNRAESEVRAAVTGILEEMLLQEGEENIPGGMSKEQYIGMQVQSIVNPWMLYFLRYDPVPALQQVKCPVLAINGEKDLQVPSKKNLEIIGKSLRSGGNKKVTTKEYPGLNHLFQTCETGSPQEYAVIQETIAPRVLKDIADWILKTTK